MASSQVDPSTLPNSTVKELAHSLDPAATVPSIYFTRGSAATEDALVVREQIPAIDFSALKRGTPDERSRVVLDIGRACQDWGCFNVVNHGVSEGLRMAMMEAFVEFFDLREEEKEVYRMKNMYEPVCYGTSTNLMGEDVRFWRDFLRVQVHPVFHYPEKPQDFRKISEEYARETREMFLELLKAIWESLGLDASLMEESMSVKSCRQTLIGNLYPQCSEPDLVLGLPPHTDPCFLTLLMQTTSFNGLQLQHNGKWVLFEPIPGSFLFLAGDFVEIASNGRYKSVVHRAMVNREITRISVGTALAPPVEDLEIAPAPKLQLQSIDTAPFRPITFKEFISLKMQSKGRGSALDLIKVPALLFLGCLKARASVYRALGRSCTPYLLSYGHLGASSSKPFVCWASRHTWEPDIYLHILDQELFENFGAGPSARRV